MRRLPLFIGIAYPIVLFGILYVVLNRDPFGIFDEGYLLLTGVVLPVTVLTLSAMIIRRAADRFWLPMIALAVWVGAVTMAHFWIVAQIAAGV